MLSLLHLNMRMDKTRDLGSWPGKAQKKTDRVGEEPGQFGERRKWYMNFD